MTATSPTDAALVAAGTCVLRGTALTKTFGHVEALLGVDIEVNAGEVLALVGDNGAGKSTLIKILSGVHLPDSGTIEVLGRPAHFPNPQAAREQRIATVFQDLALVDFRDVAANVFLGREPTRFKFLVDRRQMEVQSRAALDALRVNVPSLAEEVGNLSGGQRQGIAIARAISQRGLVVIMDEPTAALGVQESQQVLEVIAQLRDNGLGVLVVSHNLLHVFTVADRIMVLRHGRSVGVRRRAEVTPEEIVALIVGAKAA
jgi:ABC-type sugar transport system ATPase subunit